MSDPETQLAGFIAKFSPDVAAQATAVLAGLAERLPTAHRLVYDNYNALAIGFSPDDRSSNAILSIAVYPRWVSLFFLQGVGLDDPDGVLKGGGSQVRHIVLRGPDDLDRPEIVAMIARALAAAKAPLPAGGNGPLIIKSVSAKQRPRRPTAKPA
jgi:hypothetical protein